MTVCQTAPSELTPLKSRSLAAICSHGYHGYRVNVITTATRVKVKSRSMCRPFRGCVLHTSPGTH